MTPRFALPAAVAGITVSVDQASKAVVSDWLGRSAESHRFDILGLVLAFEYVENTGAAFGVFEGQGVLLTLLAGAIVAFLVWQYARSSPTSPLLAISLGLLVGGAVGNVIDRIRLGYVVDFVAVGTWPRFNVADSAVTVGVLLLAWAMTRVETEVPEGNSGAVSGPGSQVAQAHGGTVVRRYGEGR